MHVFVYNVLFVSLVGVVVVVMWSAAFLRAFCVHTPECVAVVVVIAVMSSPHRHNGVRLTILRIECATADRGDKTHAHANL